MYDFREVKAAHKAVMHTIAAHLRTSNGDAADLIDAAASDSVASTAALDQSTTAAQLWNAPSLLLTQICGLALHDRIASDTSPKLQPLATPVYTVPGCTPGAYKAWIVTRSEASATYTCLSDLAGARVAVNHIDSYSGCIGLRAAAALLEPTATPPILFFEPSAIVTGSHRASLAAVREARADCASIDCVTWALLERHCPHELRELRIIGATPGAPAPPLVTSDAVATSSTGPALCAALRFALCGSAAEGAPVWARAELAIGGMLESTVESHELAHAAFAALRQLAAKVPLWAAGDPTSPWSSPVISNAGNDQFWARVDASGFHLTVTCVAPTVQRWFDRGLCLLWGFNCEASAECFRHALALDPNCAMAHWGVALAVGVNYNRPQLTRDEMRAAASHAAAACELCVDEDMVPAIPPCERRLIEALQARLLRADDLMFTKAGGHGGDDAANGGGSELLDASVHAALDTAYEEAMREAYMHAQSDAISEATRIEAGINATSAASVADAFLLETASLFSEAIMTPRAWKLWPQDAHDAPSAAVVEARAALEAALASPGGQRHPGVSHLYVHMMEAAPSEQVGRPEVARAALALRSQWPACGHLLHMASHIDMHRGEYARAIRSGERAVDADRVYAAHAGHECYYTTYRNHHEHQLCWAAMMAGNHAAAAAASKRIIADTPPGIFAKYVDITEPLCAVDWEVDVRFGRWEALLSRPLPHDARVYRVTTAVAHYTRALALSALGRVDGALDEQRAFENAVALVPATRIIHVVASRSTLAIARRVLDGELAYRKREFDLAFETLREAVAMDDALPYDEPWGWKIPARHALGALLLERSREAAADDDVRVKATAASLVAEAEAVYRADLQRNPDNVWALTGLHACLKQRLGTDAPGTTRHHSNDELNDVAARLGRVRAHCDVDVGHSCFCAGRGFECCDVG